MLVLSTKFVVPHASTSMLEHRFAKILAVATFLLLVVGGTVNPTGSSLACPEATLVCHGSFFPAMTGGVFYEHGHRLVAESVGLLQIALTVLLLRRRKQHKKLAFGLLGMVIVQGGLGALTVHYKLPWYVSTGHLLWGFSYFAMLIYTAFLTRRAPSVVEMDRQDRARAELGSARTWIAIACGTVFTQLLLGALVRHLGASLVCPGMPTCEVGGALWPDAAIQQLQMVHRVFGVITAIVTTTAAVIVLRHAKSWTGLRTLAMLAPVLVLAQITLGILTVLSWRYVPLAVGHFAGAASLWALWTSAWFLTAPRSAASAVASRPRAAQLSTPELVAGMAAHR
jgi:cytochrome c oxidase assembly protein subunit 15